MTKGVVTVGYSDTMQKAITKIMDHRVSTLPVVEKGRLIGIVTDRDLRRAAPSDATLIDVDQLRYHLSSVEIGAIMSRDPKTVPPDFTLEETAEMLLKHNISGCPVVDYDGQMVGIITKKDLFKAMISLAGLTKRGIQFGLLVDDRPGSIREMTDIIRNRGGRIVSIMTSYHNVPKGSRHVFVRSFMLDREHLPEILSEMKSKAKVLYMVDHRENKREIFQD